jgi:hypothetical protein
MPQWRRNSVFGEGPRIPLDREQRAQFRAKLQLQRRPGRLPSRRCRSAASCLICSV